MFALSVFLTLKMSRLLYGCDVIRFRRLILLFILRPILAFFWHSSARLDCPVWLYFLQKPDLSYRFIAVTASSLLAGFTFGFLRGEFILVPIGTVMAATAALMFSVKSYSYFLFRFYWDCIGGLASAYVWGFHSIHFNKGLRDVDLVADQHGADSLGMSLIVISIIPYLSIYFSNSLLEWFSD